MKDEYVSPWLAPMGESKAPIRWSKGVCEMCSCNADAERCHPPVQKDIATGKILILCTSPRINEKHLTENSRGVRVQAKTEISDFTQCEYFPAELKTVVSRRRTNS